MTITRNPTRSVRLGSIQIGHQHPIAVQSMTATPTQDVAATVQQVNALHEAGADVVRIAVDSDKDAQALAEIRRQTQANLSVDLQENYRLAEKVAPMSTRYATTPVTYIITKGRVPGRTRSSTWWRSQPRMTVPSASVSTAAASIRRSRGSIPATRWPILTSGLEHVDQLERLGFTRFVVLKDSDPATVVRINQAFAPSGPVCRCIWE